MSNEYNSKIKMIIEKTSNLSKNEIEKIKTLLQKHNSYADKILPDKEKTQEILNKVLAKMEKVKLKPVGHFLKDMKVMVELVSDTITGKYTGIPYKSIIAITGALIYFLSPIDIIPDIIPVAGLIDDTFVLGLILKQFATDIEVYKAWKKSKEEIIIELKKENLKDNPTALKEFEEELKEDEK